MSSGKIAGIAIGTLVIGIAIGFFIPTDSGIEQTTPVPMMQTESVDYGIDKITIGFIPSEKADELTPKVESLARFLPQTMSG